MPLATLHSWLNDVLGLDQTGSNLGVAQMAARAIVLFPCALAMTRLAGKRFLGRSAAFDVVLAIVLGSVISRAINGQAAFFPTIGVGFVLVLLHRIVAMASSRWHGLSVLLKGREAMLIRNGQVDRTKLREVEFSDDDLLENLRLEGLGSPAEVAEARLERNGHVSVLKKKP
jgi:uncharacterized membrane protein YcaP (DUF421 family)